MKLKAAKRKQSVGTRQVERARQRNQRSKQARRTSAHGHVQKQDEAKHATTHDNSKKDEVGSFVLPGQITRHPFPYQGYLETTADDRSSKMRAEESDKEKGNSSRALKAAQEVSMEAKGALQRPLDGQLVARFFQKVTR